jgi:hypothetical protein
MNPYETTWRLGPSLTVSRLFQVFVLLAACSGPMAHAIADPVFPDGLRIGLAPAGDLKPSPGFPGFRDQDRQASVTLAELPGPAYEAAARALFGELPAGASEVARQVFPFHDGMGYLHVAELTENGKTTRRWLLLARPMGLKQDLVILVSVSVPEAARGIYSDAVVRKMLASVTVREPPIEERLGLIPFTIDDLAGFRVAQVSPQSVLLIDGPGNDLGTQPYIIVSIGRAEPKQMEDRGRFSRDLLINAPLRDLALQSADAMRIGGSPGFEIRAQAKDLHDNKLSIVQWVRFTGGGFLRIVGATPAERWDELFNRFRAVRDGVDLR